MCCEYVMGLWIGYVYRSGVDNFVGVVNKDKI